MAFSGEEKREYNKKYAQKKKEAKEFVKSLQDSEPIPGELLTPFQLWCVFNGFDKNADQSSIADNTPKKKDKEDRNKIKRIKVFGRKLEGSEKEIDIDTWLARRRELRAEMWDLANNLYGHKGKWHEKAHRILFDFFVKKDNSTLPVKYTQDQLNEWLLDQSEKHNRLLEFPRGFRKTTACLIDIIQWILNAPDTTHLICTSTRKLGKLRIEEVRSHFEVKNYNEPTDFQCYFPEFCIPVGDGEGTEYRCPMAHLDIPYATLAYTSVESSTAGFRATHVTFDDAQDDKNYKKPEQRMSVAETFDLVCELIIRPYGYCTVVGTRYTDGAPGDNPDGQQDDEKDTRVRDLYGEIIRRIEKSEDDRWEILIKPAWVTLSHASGKKFKDYVSEDVELLMDYGPGLFKILKAKAVDNERNFRCQQLNQPAALTDGDDAPYINTFTEENIYAKVKRISEIPVTFSRKAIFVDTALTDGRKSDWNALVAAGIEDKGEDQDPLIWFPETRAVHASDKEIARQIVEMMIKWDCSAYVEEIPGQAGSFKNEVLQQLQLRRVSHNISWFTPEGTRGAKEKRIRGLQLLHEKELLRFGNCTGIEEMVRQLVRYNGDKKLHKTSKSGRKDDLPDAMGYVEKILPYIASVHTEEEKEVREDLEKKERRRAFYNMIHGVGPTSTTYINTQQSLEEPPAVDPIHEALSQLGRFQRSGPTIGFSRGSKKDGNEEQ